MSGLQGSLYSSVTGLNAFSAAISATGDKIANSSATGYKGPKIAFNTMVAASGSNVSYSAGGTNSITQNTISTAGAFSATGNPTDFAVSGGQGMIVVTDKADLSGDILFTRNGDCDWDNNGMLKNANGFYVLAYPVDSQGRLPGAPGNANTASTSSISSLQPINKSTVNESAFASTSVSLGLNLDAGEQIFHGPGETLSFPSSSINYQTKSSDILLPDTTAGIQLGVGDSITLTPSQTGIATTYTYGGFATSPSIAGGIAGVNNVTTPFVGPSNGDGITISGANIGNVTFQYQANAPDTSKGQFNSISTFVDAINSVSGLTARIQGDNFYVSATDTTQAINFTNIGVTNFLTDFNLPATLGGTANTFTTLDGLNSLIAATGGISSSINSPSINSTLGLYAQNPLDTLTVTATSAATPSAASSAAIFAQLGITDIVSGATLPATYNPANPALNMSGGKITPDHREVVTVYDSEGFGHDIAVNFLKTGVNQWAVETTAINPSDVILTRTDGQLSAGYLQFNGDSSLNSVSSALISPMQLQWSDQAATSNITVDWGTYGPMAGTNVTGVTGKTNGISQFDSGYNKSFINTDGNTASTLSGVTIDESGNVIASYQNSQTKVIGVIPLAVFPSVNNLTPQSGNVFSQTEDSGAPNLVIPGAGTSAGKIASGFLEQSNVDIANEITNLIIYQRSYQSCSKAIKAVDELLSQLNQLV